MRPLLPGFLPVRAAVSALSWTSKVAGVDLIAKVKWLPGFDVGKRPEGGFIRFKFVTKF